MGKSKMPIEEVAFIEISENYELADGTTERLIDKSDFIDTFQSMREVIEENGLLPQLTAKLLNS